MNRPLLCCLIAVLCINAAYNEPICPGQGLLPAHKDSLQAFRPADDINYKGKLVAYKCDKNTYIYASILGTHKLLGRSSSGRKLTCLCVQIQDKLVLNPTDHGKWVDVSSLFVFKNSKSNCELNG